MLGSSVMYLRPGTDRETPRSRLAAAPGQGQPMSEHQPTPAYLRERAAFYRQRAREAHNPTKVKEYLYIAEVLNREADAFKNITTNQNRASA